MIEPASLRSEHWRRRRLALQKLIILAIGAAFLLAVAGQHKQTQHSGTENSERMTLPPPLMEFWQPHPMLFGRMSQNSTVWEAAFVPGGPEAQQRSLVPDEQGWHLHSTFAPDANGAATYQLVMTLLKMVLLNRMSVHGSYEVPAVLLTSPTVEGWVRTKTWGGRFELNAVLFTQPTTRRAVLVLKETDSGVMDREKGLFENCCLAFMHGRTPEERHFRPPWAPPGATCEDWSEAQRDLPSQALTYAVEFLGTAPDYDLLLVGHSSGGAFAVLAAAALLARGYAVHALVFSNCPWRLQLRERFGLEVSETLKARLFYVPDRYDPVSAYAAAADDWSGTYCVWDGAPVDAACGRCFVDFPHRITTRCGGHDDFTPDPCWSCFMDHHTTHSYHFWLPKVLSPERAAAGLVCVDGSALNASDYPGVPPPTASARALLGTALSVVHETFGGKGRDYLRELGRVNAESVRAEVATTWSHRGICATWTQGEGAAHMCSTNVCFWNGSACIFDAFLSHNITFVDDLFRKAVQAGTRVRD